MLIRGGEKARKMDMTGMVFGSYMGGLMRPSEGLISRLLMASENNRDQVEHGRVSYHVFGSESGGWRLPQPGGGTRP